ncbi:MAG TPA: site-2 protease family protein [Candidatus Angelobacter sp.]
MSTYPPQVSQTCRRCSRPLTPGALACESCHALVHADEMEQLAAQAREMEARQDFAGARERWLSVLPLLPPESQQAQWIQGHTRELEFAVQQGTSGLPTHQAKTAPGADPAAGNHPSVLPDRSDMKRTWAKRLAPIAPLAAILAKGKTFLFAIFKLKFLFSFAAFLSFYWAVWGMRFGVGFALLILIHEMGHFIEIKRHGLKADLPVFLPGVMAYVRWEGMGVSLETRSLIALAGPCAGFLAAVVCGLLWWQTGQPFWAALARTSAWLNVLNLIPVVFLDGGHAAQALSKLEKAMLMGVSAGLFYATTEGVFIFVALGAAWQLVRSFFVAHPAQAAVTRLDLSQSGQAVQTRASYAPAENLQTSSPLIAAYFIALLVALGLVMYLLPGHSAGIP